MENMDNKVTVLTQVQSDLERVRERSGQISKSIENISASLNKIFDEIIDILEHLKK